MSHELTVDDPGVSQLKRVDAITFARDRACDYFGSDVSAVDRGVERHDEMHS